jgi:FAD/FMN-containing dehydrogenase
MFNLAPHRGMKHNAKVDRVAQQLRQRKSTQPVSLRKKSVSHMVPKAFDKKYRDQKIDVSSLGELLEINVNESYCVAEPGLTFFDLVNSTLAHNLVPTVVPELKTVTVGGAVAGCSIESMSFRHGGFHDSCLEYEVITGDGRVLICRPDGDNSLIFQMLHGTFGTLGIISKVKFRLVPAKPFVKVQYEKYSTLPDYLAAIQRHYKNKDIEFMDGIIHSPDLYVLSAGNFVDSAPYTNNYDWMKIYYQSTAERDEDYLKTADYFFRYDKGVTNVHPKSKIARFFLGKFVGSSEILRLAEKIHWLLPAERPPVTVDIFLPFSKVEEFMGWYEREMGHFPLWCVPYHRLRDYEWVSPRLFQKSPDSLYIDLAIYSMPQRGQTNYYRLLEEKLLEIGGIKTLISHNYYTEEEFWSAWNKENYDKVKKVTDPHGIFRDLYTKTCSVQ